MKSWADAELQRLMAYCQDNDAERFTNTNWPETYDRLVRLELAGLAPDKGGRGAILLPDSERRDDGTD